jgi:hypothetical protein
LCAREAPRSAWHHRIVAKRPLVSRARARLLCAFLVAAPMGFVTSCAPHSDFMREPATAAGAIPVAPRDVAVVVFVRPSTFAYLARYAIVDVPVHMEAGAPKLGRPRFLGDSLADSHFAVVVPPGPRIFVAYHPSDPVARSDAMRASLLPGRTYYVEVSPGMSGVSLLAVTPRSETWSKLTSWIAETNPLVPDREAGQAALEEDPEDAGEEVETGWKHLSDNDAAELEERTLRPEDGT